MWVKVSVGGVERISLGVAMCVQPKLRGMGSHREEQASARVEGHMAPEVRREQEQHLLVERK